MTEKVKTEDAPSMVDDMAQLRARAENLEQQLAALQRETAARLVLAALKVEAQRTGIVDLDGLKLIDSSHLKLNQNGDVEGAATLIAELKHAKPWLFGTASSSTVAKAPPAQPPRQKLASEMNDEEYRNARASLLKRRG